MASSTSTYAPRPAGALSIDEILADARAHLTRCTPAELYRELLSPQRSGVVHVVDIRPAAQREREGEFALGNIFTTRRSAASLAAAAAAGGNAGNAGNASSRGSVGPKQAQHHVIERNVLEWRLDPQSDARLKNLVDVDGYATRVVVVCSEGYTSSLAARELQRIGLRSATDLVGGVRAWQAFLDEVSV